MDALIEIYSEYKQCQVFKVTHIEGDNAFKCIRSELQAKPFHNQLTTCDVDNHIPKIEREA